MTTAARLFAVVAVAVLIVSATMIAYAVGVQAGRTFCAADAWVTPHNAEWCVVYPDGGKRCTLKREAKR